MLNYHNHHQHHHTILMRRAMMIMTGTTISTMNPINGKNNYACSLTLPYTSIYSIMMYHLLSLYLLSFVHHSPLTNHSTIQSPRLRGSLGRRGGAAPMTRTKQGKKADLSDTVDTVICMFFLSMLYPCSKHVYPALSHLSGQNDLQFSFSYSCQWPFLGLRYVPSHRSPHWMRTRIWRLWRCEALVRSGIPQQRGNRVLKIIGSLNLPVSPVKL